jgi:hypothetical protein
VPPGLDGARELPVVAAPPGCSFQALESLERPEVLADDAAVAARLACAPGTTPALALGDDQLMLAAHRLSPASVGLAVFDDGATITYVSRQRPPCADDPPPMPSPSVPLAFRLPRGATRAFRTLACDLPPSCP